MGGHISQDTAMEHEQHALLVYNAETDKGNAILRYILASPLRRRFSRLVASVEDVSRATQLSALGIHVIQFEPNRKQMETKLKHLGIDVVCVVPIYDQEGEKGLEMERTRNFLEACEEAVVPSVFLLSQVGCDLPHLEFLPQFRQLEEEFEKRKIMTQRIIRVGLLQQFLLNYAYSIAWEEKLPLPINDSLKCSPLNLLDMAEFVAFCLAYPDLKPPHPKGSISYSLVGPEQLTPRDICDRVSRHTGQKCDYEEMSRDDHFEYLKRFPILPIERKMLMDYYQLWQEGQLDFLTDDYELVLGKTGRKIDVFLEHQCMRFKKH